MNQLFQLSKPRSISNPDSLAGSRRAALWVLESVSVAGRVAARLDNVSAEICEGVTAVLGQSGAGKTSLLNLLVGYESASSGRVQFHGTAPERRLAVFWAPPHQGLWPHLSVREHLTSVSPLSSRDRIDHADHLLEKFDLQQVASAKPNSLSLGEGSRLNVARAIASQALVLVMDEPLSHVDAARCGKYWDALREACAAQQSSLIFSTHAPDVVLREARHLLCLANGRVVYQGAVSELYEQPATLELAEMLGPCNWFNNSELQTWFIESEAGFPKNGQAPATIGHCVRPEQIHVETAPTSPFRVTQSRFLGTSAEVTVTDDRNGNERRFHYRPRGLTRIPIGERVLLRLLLLLLMMGIIGCSEESYSIIPVKHEVTWMVPAAGTKVPAPRGMTVTRDDEYMVLDNVGRVLVYNNQGQVERQWWMPEYSVGKPEGICKLKDGRIAVADTHYHRVVFFKEDGQVVGMFGQHGSKPGDFVYPVKITQDPDENIYVCEYGHNDRVQKFRPDGTFLLQFGGSGTEPGQFQRPCGIAWFDHRLYVVDAFNNRIQVFEEDGQLVEILSDSDKMADLYYPYDIAVDSHGDLYVVEYGSGRVSKFNRQGRLLGRYGTTGNGQSMGQLLTPWGMAIDRRGWLYVCDTGNRRIVELEL